MLMSTGTPNVSSICPIFKFKVAYWTEHNVEFVVNFAGSEKFVPNEGLGVKLTSLINDDSSFIHVLFKLVAIFRLFNEMTSCCESLTETVCVIVYPIKLETVR